MLEALAAEGHLERRGGGYVRAGAQAPPDPLEQELLQAWRAMACSPGAIAALAARAGVAPAEARAALDRLVARGEVVRAKPGIYYHPDAVERARAEVVALCEREGAVTIARLRDGWHRPQARTGPAGAPRRDPGHPPRGGRARPAPVQIADGGSFY